MKTHQNIRYVVKFSDTHNQTRFGTQTIGCNLITDMPVNMTPNDMIWAWGQNTEQKMVQWRPLPANAARSKNVATGHSLRILEQTVSIGTAKYGEFIDEG